MNIETYPRTAQETNVPMLVHTHTDQRQVREAREVFIESKQATIQLSNAYNRYADITIFLDIRMPNLGHEFLCT